MGRFLLILVLAVSTALAQEDQCVFVNKSLEMAKFLCEADRNFHKALESSRFVLSSLDLASNRALLFPNKINFATNDSRDGEIFTKMAKVMQTTNDFDPKTFKDVFDCLGRKPNSKLKTRPKYRSIDGLGNNLKKSSWGAAGFPFGRYGKRNYADEIYSIRRAFWSDNELPGPRQLVENILKKAKKIPRTSKIPNQLAMAWFFLITHDIGHQTPNEAFNPVDKIRCCKTGNSFVLGHEFSHSACAAIKVMEDDAFYGEHSIGCLNFVRSQIANQAFEAQFGEPANRATAFADLSIIYGCDPVEALKVRSFSKGKILTNENQILPVDANGALTKIGMRLAVVITGTLWASLFLRQHNSLAESLSAMNPKWDDEKCYQEARRINIALFQNFMFNDEFSEVLIGKSRDNDDSYNEKTDPSTTVEFISAAGRFPHFFVDTNVLFVDSDGNENEVTLGGTLGRLDFLTNSFEDLVRGCLRQELNFGEYTSELSNHFVPNANDIGLDVLSFDIQRGRDHGLGTYLQTRKKCGLKDIQNFKDFKGIIPAEYIKLLEQSYEFPEDIDLVVGGSLESMTNPNEFLFGETFRCVLRDQYKKVKTADAYFFSSKANPNPFTSAQLKAIADFSITQLICKNSEVSVVPEKWYLAENPDTNPDVFCEDFAPIDLKPWLES